MKITGTTECEKCKEKLEWEYLVPLHSSSRSLEVDMINTQIYHPVKIKHIDATHYLFSIQCKQCNHITNFTVESRTYL